MPTIPRGRSIAMLTVMAALLGACRDSSTPPELSAPAKLLLVSGDDQAVVNAPAPAAEELVVKVVDPKDRPVSGVTITWTASDPAASLSSTTSTTDGEGLARVKWTIGGSSGVQTVKATSPELAGASVVFQGRNTVLSINGGVTVGSGIPLTLSPSPSIGPRRSADAERLASGVVFSAAATARAVGSSPGTVRRLIVQFKPSVAGASRAVVLNASGLTRSAETMR